MVSSDVDLVAEVRALNTDGVEIPWVWFLAEKPIEPHGLNDPVMLTFGIYNNIGALSWDDGEKSYVPTTGMNSDWRTYYSAGSHDTAIPSYAEVPVKKVYLALAEFLGTRTRPTVVEWQEAASIKSRFA